jgi:hypothetical protein
VVKHFPSVCKVLGSTPSTARKKEKRKEGGRETERKRKRKGREEGGRKITRKLR